MTIEERAARHYCEIKGINPDGINSDWTSNLHTYIQKFDEFLIMLHCIEQAKSTK